jgi:hypothetical protein
MVYQINGKKPNVNGRTPKVLVNCGQFGADEQKAANGKGL